MRHFYQRERSCKVVFLPGEAAKCGTDRARCCGSQTTRHHHPLRQNSDSPNRLPGRGRPQNNQRTCTDMADRHARLRSATKGTSQLQIDPKLNPQESTEGQLRTIRDNLGPKWARKGANWASYGSKEPQRCPKEATGAKKVPQRCPKGAKKCTKGAQMGPKGSPTGPQGTTMAHDLWNCHPVH